MNIIHVTPESIRPAEWKTNHILTPDLRLLRKSIADYGWLYPVIVRKEDMTIIDGFARWLIATDDASYTDKGKIPVSLIDCDEANAIIMHIRLNRARGSIVAKYLASAVQKLVQLGYTDSAKLSQILGMSFEEYEVISEPRYLKAKKLAAHEYSRAWVPIEIPVGVVSSVQEMKFERPPTPDS